jgi:glycosyltransferase involved in cell wall biosynthesis
VPVEVRPVVVILMPALNAAKTLQRAVVSVGNQTSAEWTLQILVDPATRDKTLAEAKRLKGSVKGTVHVNMGRSPGLPYQYTELIDRAEPVDGICGFLDADDTLLPEAVESVVRTYREHPDAEVVWSQFVFMPRGTRGWSRPLPKGTTFKTAFLRSWWGAQHFRTFKKSVYERSSFGIPLHLPYAVDHSLALVLAAADPVGRFLDKILYGYYQLSSGISKRSTQRQRQCYHAGLRLFWKHIGCVAQEAKA